MLGNVRFTAYSAIFTNQRHMHFKRVFYNSFSKRRAPLLPIATASSSSGAKTPHHPLLRRGPLTERASSFWLRCSYEHRNHCTLRSSKASHLRAPSPAHGPKAASLDFPANLERLRSSRSVGWTARFPRLAACATAIRCAATAHVALGNHKRGLSPPIRLAALSDVSEKRASCSCPVRSLRYHFPKQNLERRKNA